jgi:glycosyltransferase involved in cell wall biosynthesis
VKVLHVAPSIARTYGGPTYSLAGYARAAMGESIELTIAAPAPPVDDSWLATSVPHAELHLFRTYGRGAFLASPALRGWLRANGSRFDVVHVHGLLNPVSSLAARMCVRRGWPVIVRPFGTMSRYTYQHRRGALKRVYRRLLDRPNLRRVSAVHFTTTAERAESAWQQIDWGARAFVIPPPWIEPSDGTSRTPSPDSLIVLFLSRLHPVKRVEQLLDAWTEVHRRVPGARLIIAGAGEPSYVNTLQARAKASGDSISFSGFVDGSEKRELLRSAGVFVLTSQHENFGISVLEAIAAGVPVVVSAEVQLSSFVREHALGIITDHLEAAVANAVVAALEDRVLRERCRMQGAALIARYFSPHTIGTQLLDMYRFAATHPPA